VSQDMKHIRVYGKVICQHRHSHHMAPEVGSRDVHETNMCGQQWSF